MADIPGLIPGSYQNKGMGISFLRHIERCLGLVFVIDMALEHPWEQLYRLNFELEKYQEGLSKRPSILVCNKIDLPGADIRLEKFKERLRTDGIEIRISPEQPTEDRKSTDSVTEHHHWESSMDEYKITDCQETIINDTRGSDGGGGDHGRSHGGGGGNDGHGKECDDQSLLVLGVSAKKKVGINEFLNELRVLHDRHSIKS